MTAGHFFDRSLEAEAIRSAAGCGIAPAIGIDDRAKDLICAFEPLHLRSIQGISGTWTIGYGHTLTARPGTVVSIETAKRLLDGDLTRIVLSLAPRLPSALPSHQRAAIIAFTANLGVSSLLGSSLLAALIEGQTERVAAEFFRWYGSRRHPRRSCLPRRLAERALFLGQDWRPWQGWLPYPPLSLATASALPTSAVLQVQICLGHAGFDVCPDGSFGPETDAALRQFQGDRRILPDGIAGPVTQAALAVPNFANLADRLDLMDMGLSGEGTAPGNRRFALRGRQRLLQKDGGHIGRIGRIGQ